MKLPIAATSLVILSVSALSAAVPLNLARWQSGATLLKRDYSNNELIPVSPLVKNFDKSPEAALLSDDPAQGFRLDAGASEYIIDLGMVRTVKEFGFQSFSATTECIVSASLSRSAAADAWRGMGQVTSAPGAISSLKSAPIQARYIKLTFNTATPGEISSVLLNGVEQADTARVQRPSRLAPQEQPGAPGMIAVDLSSATQGAKVLGVQGLAEGQEVSSLLDQNPLTTATFSGKQPAVLMLDLGADSDVDALAFNHNGSKGMLQVHLLSAELPVSVILNKEAGADSMTLRPSFFVNRKPEFVLNATNGDYRSRKTFSPKAVRYVVARWVPADTDSAGPVFGGFSVIGTRSPERVLPRFLVTAGGFAETTVEGVVVGAGGAPKTPRSAPRGSNPAAVEAREADIITDAAKFSTNE